MLHGLRYLILKCGLITVGGWGDGDSDGSKSFQEEVGSFGCALNLNSTILSVL